MPVHAFPSPVRDRPPLPAAQGDSRDAETLAFYEANATTYADQVSRTRADGDLKTFIQALPPASFPGTTPVLDWGCGPGNSAALLEEVGISCEATDACTAMAAIAADLGVSVRVEPFEALDPVPLYRGIWANFSLMHAPSEMFAPLLLRAAGALVTGGVLHIGLDTAIGHHCRETRRHCGIRFALHTPDEILAAVRAAGLLPVSARSGNSRMFDGTPLTFHILLARKPD